MLNRIRYRKSKIKTNICLSVKDNLKTVDLSNLSKGKKIFTYIKGFFISPKNVFLSLIGKRLNIKYVEIVLTTYCTLNCKGCSALMTYYKNSERENIDLDKNKKAIKRLVEVSNSIDHLRLLGGEPLLYPNLYEILKYTEKEDKIKRVTIVTNGTINLTDKKMINILKKPKFDVNISDYGKLSCKKEELMNTLNSNNIKYDIRGLDLNWRDYGDIIDHKRTNKELKTQMSKCNIICYSIMDGKLHHCPRSTHGIKLNRIPLLEKDYIDLFDNSINNKILRKKLHKFFYGYVPYIEACKYCNSGTNELKDIPAAEQEKKNN